MRFFLYPDRMARVFAVPREEGYLLRWIWSDCVGIVVECCPGPEPLASWVGWN